MFLKATEYCRSYGTFHISMDKIICEIITVTNAGQRILVNKTINFYH